MANNSPLFINIGPGLSTRIGLPLIVSWDSENRPQKAPRGTFGFNTETQSLEYWDGESWYEIAMGK